MITVEFDFDGALSLARALHAAGSDLRDLERDRSVVIERSLHAWRGPAADTFRTMVEREADEVPPAANGLELDAQAWAQAWADAMNEQNRLSRQQAITVAENERSALEATKDAILVAQPAANIAEQVWINPPEPPNFAPTGTFQRF